jgi:3-mercaptopyruvate sulfurtransferase SseA
MEDRWMLRCAGMALLAILAAPFARAQFTPAESAFSIPQAQLIQPEALNSLMQSARTATPLVLQVGSRVLFAEAHIPGAEYAGPGSQPEGLERLRSRVNAMQRNELIVLYCGCCPWQRCPNVGPAYAKLRAMGFRNVKVLYLADNFGADWAARGYPVEQSR